jgi:hypothetical protein
MRANAFVVVLSMVLLSTAALAGDSARLADRTHVSGLTQANDLLSKGPKAEVPGLISFQGTLTDAASMALDTTVSMTFSIYADSTGGSPVPMWWETQPAVVVNHGLFNVLLGRVNAFPDTVFKDPIRWLAVQVGSDPTMEPRQRIASVGYAFWAAKADTAEYARSAAAVSDGDWTVSYNILYPAGDYGLSMRSSNAMHGQDDSTHVNFGIACTTGTSGQNYKYCSVGGGYNNTSSYSWATVGGGRSNTASDEYATVSGGRSNTASGMDATVAGGYDNTASGMDATVGGGVSNDASDYSATVGGGDYNTASNYYATVGSGYGNDSDGDYSFTVGNQSYVPSSYSNSAAFNGQTATASSQTRVGALSKASGTFTIDHPTQPMNKILNHYFVESPEMVLIYRGVAIIGSEGRAEVQLPDYFDALNRNPMVQLTGVGTSDVYVAEKVTGNRFVIGGKPGTEVYWTVTGDRKDLSAEITRLLMPVEQLKDGDLTGHSLDDDFLASTMSQLERMGQAGKFSFRTQAGREKFERSRQALENQGQMEPGWRD